MSVTRLWTKSWILGLLVAFIGGILVQVPAWSTPTLKLTSSVNQDIMAGERVLIAGTVAGGKTTQSIQVEQLVKKRWSKVASRKLRVGSTFSLSLKVTKAGIFKYRVVYASNKGKVTFSPFVVARVRQWYYLSDLQPVEGDTWRLHTGAASINGQKFAHSVYREYCHLCEDESKKIQWNLQRKCSVLDATIGMTDDSESNDVYSIELFLDQAEGSHYDLELGKANKVKFDIRNGLRLVVNFVALTDRNSGSAALGNARIACLPLN